MDFLISRLKGRPRLQEIPKLQWNPAGLRSQGMPSALSPLFYLYSWGSKWHLPMDLDTVPEFLRTLYTLCTVIVCECACMCVS